MAAHAIFRVVHAARRVQKKKFAGREKTDDVWIGGGGGGGSGSGGSGEYDCVHQTALYKNKIVCVIKSALRSLPICCPCHFYGGAARRVKITLL